MLARKSKAALFLQPTLRRSIGMLDPVTPLQNPPAFTNFVRSSIEDPEAQAEIIEEINNQEKVHVYSTYRMNIFTRKLVSLEAWLALIAFSALTAGLYRTMSRVEVEDTAKLRKQRKMIAQFFYASLFANVFVVGGLFYLARKMRLSVLKNVYFYPKEKKYELEFYKKNMRDVASAKLSPQEIVFEKPSARKGYQVVFKPPGESKQRVCKANGIWVNSKLVDVIKSEFGN